MSKPVILTALALTLAWGFSTAPATAAGNGNKEMALRAATPAAAETPAAAATEPAVAAAPAPAAGATVGDDDGGAAQIVPRRSPGSPAAGGAPAVGELSFHGGAVVAGGEVRAIFLGRAWRQEANRRREAKVNGELLGRWEEMAQAALSRCGVRTRDLTVQSQEDLLDPRAGREISDLDVQARLDEMLSGGAADPAGAVYVIFLAPGLRSTLGTSDSERTYVAYHNHFHAAGGVVRYTVVPYEADPARWLANARQALLQALVNPEGDGWY
jgi:hypothetical protein